jgi:hypothetical protein
VGCAIKGPRRLPSSGCKDRWRHVPSRLHAAEPHGLGRTDPGVSFDGDNCRVANTWLGRSECEEMERRWSTHPLSPSDRGPIFIGCIQVDGSVWVPITFHVFFLCLEAFAALSPDPSNQTVSQLRRQSKRGRLLEGSRASSENSTSSLMPDFAFPSMRFGGAPLTAGHERKLSSWPGPVGP